MNDPVIEYNREMKRAQAAHQRKVADWFWRILIAIPGAILIGMQVTAVTGSFPMILIGMGLILPLILKLMPERIFHGDS